MKKAVCFAIIAAALIACFTLPAGAIDENPTVRIGLYYGSNTLPSANLQNVTGYGCGYDFGYFNSSYNFISVASTDEIKITMMKDKNIYLVGSTYYGTMPSSSYSVIGAYHIQPDASYSSYEAAKAAADCYSDINAFPAYINGKYYVRIGSYTTASNAISAMESLGMSNASVVGGSSTCITVTITTTTTIIFEYDIGTTAGMAVSPIQTDVDITPQTWFKGYKYYGAFQYRRLYGDDITVINYVTMQQYIKGVIPYEMSSSWPLEALKAQALCAKSYAATYIGRHSSSGFDFCNTTHCQVYYGTNAANGTTDQAVDETYGMYIYYDGSPAQTVYHASDGGSTEDAVNVWGNEVPYLKAVTDIYEGTITITGYNWSYTYTKDELTWLLQNKGYDCGDIVDVYISKYTDAGNVYTVTFIDENGKNYSFSKESARTIWYSSTLGMSAKSMRYTIVPNATLYVNDSGGTLSGSSLSGAYAIGSGGDISKISSGSSLYIISSSGTSTLDTTSDSVTISGTGSGHNVGMSQWGAKAMALLGYSYEDIISFYYTDVTIE